jgi:hypothetical protein
VLQANALAGLDEVLAANAAEIRVVENEIAEFRALLDKVHLRKRMRALQTLSLKATLVGMLAGTVSSSPINPCGLWNSPLQNSSPPPNLAFLRNWH